MSVTVRDVLSLDIVQSGDPEVVAGEANLDRPIRWVHIADVVDVAPLLKGSELLLTSGLGLSAGQAEQRGYIRRLTEAGVAGVFMSMGWAHHEPPRALVAEARRQGLPFVVIHKPIPFVEVTEEVHTEILNRQFALLQKADRIGRSFTDLVLHGSGPRQVVHALGRVVNKPVVLENAAHQVVEFQDPESLASNLVSRWEGHARSGHRSRGRPLLVVIESGAGCAWIDIPLREEVWGRLHVLLRGGPLDEMDRLALDRAAIAISMLLLSQRYTDAVLDQVGGDLIVDLIRGSAYSEPEVHDRALALGCDLHDRRLMALAIDADDFAEQLRARGLEEDEVRRVKLAMLGATRRAIEGAGCQGIATVISDEVVGLVAVQAERDAGQALDEIGVRARSEIAAATGLRVTVGVGREAGSVLALPRAFFEAREAVGYGKGRPEPVHHFGRLGLDTLILRLRDSAELTQFVESELGALLAHDARRKPPLLPTLQAYLDRGGNKSATAKAVHLERRSLYHRLDKISDLLNRDLDEPETRTRLHVALRALAILRRREPAVAGDSPLGA